MNLYIRKINKAKWMKNNLLDNEVSADAITNCLKTQGNTLSVWTTDNKEENINKAILALVSSGEHLESIDIVLLDRIFIDKNNLQLIQCEGNTPIAQYKSLHFDISDLTYWKLGYISEYIVEELRQEKVIRMSRKTLKTMLNDAIQNSILKKDDLNPSLALKL